MKDVLTKKETAKYLRISIRTLDRWVAAGIVPCFKGPGRNGRVLFNKDLVDEAVTEQ
ncbi:DNA-binding protein [Clostridiales bacterium]|nr:DNA-binding protein [Clostridiales bacterium]